MSRTRKDAGAYAVTEQKGQIFACSICERRWTGYAECHCMTCHQNFSSEKSFDIHRVGDYATNKRRCLIQIEMHDLTNNNGRKLLALTERKYGKTWVTI